MIGDPRYRLLAVADGKRADPTKYWWQEYVLPEALRFVHKHLGNGQRLLIHCGRGDTRAPAIAAAVLAAFGSGAAGASAVLEVPSDSSTRRPVSKEVLRQCLVTVQRFHPFCAVPRRIMQQLNLFFVTAGGGWSS